MDGNWLRKIFFGLHLDADCTKKQQQNPPRCNVSGGVSLKRWYKKKMCLFTGFFLDTLYTSLSPSGALRHNGLPVGHSPQKEHTYHTMLWGHLNSSTLEFRLPLKIVQHSWTGFHSEKHMVGRIVARPSIQLGWTLAATDTNRYQGGREGLKLATLGFIN